MNVLVLVFFFVFLGMIVSAFHAFHRWRLKVLNRKSVCQVTYKIVKFITIHDKCNKIWKKKQTRENCDSTMRSGLCVCTLCVCVLLFYCMHLHVQYSLQMKAGAIWCDQCWRQKRNDLTLMTFMTLRLIFTQYSVEFEAKMMPEKWNEKKEKQNIINECEVQWNICGNEKTMKQFSLMISILRGGHDSAATEQQKCSKNKMLFN